MFNIDVQISFDSFFGLRRSEDDSVVSKQFDF